MRCCGAGAGAQVLYIVYCFFVLVLVACYTANLTAYLTITTTNAEIASLADLVRRRALLGVNPGGSTAAYFASGEDALARRAAHLVRYCATDDCLASLRGGALGAFVSDRPLLRYQAKLSPCDLTVTGDDFGPGEP